MKRQRSARTKKFRRVRLLAVISLITAAVFLYLNRRISTGSTAGDHFIGTPTTRPSGPYLRVGTFNIDGGQGLDGKTDLARTARCEQKLDFIGMNEVHGFVFQQPINQAITLSSLLHLPYLYVPAEQQWGHETFGNAVFSNLVVTHWQRVELPSQLFKAKRNYLLTDVLWHGKVLHILTTHTDWKTGGDEQLRIVSDVFLKLPLPAILMGDLNSPASNPRIGELQKTPGVQEAIGTVLDPIHGRVDWIFVKGFTTVDAGEVDIKASDHPAYWAALSCRNNFHPGKQDYQSSVPRHAAVRS